MKKKFLVFSNQLLIIIGLTLISHFSFASNKLAFTALIKGPDGEWLQVPSTSVKASLLSPNRCILFEEEVVAQNILNGILRVSLGDGVRTGSDPGFSLVNAFSNLSALSSLTCLDSSGTVNVSLTSYTPASSDERVLRLEFEHNGQPVAAEFSLKGSAFANQSYSLEGKAAVDFAQINAGLNLSQANLESIFSRFTKLDAVLNNFDAAGTLLGANITGNSQNVSGTVLVANGGTGASTASGARTNLGLGTLAVMSPTGTAAGTTFLRGDGVWAVPSGAGGSVDSVSATSPLTVSGTAQDPVINLGNISFAGDVSGNQGTMSVDKIRGSLVHTTAPTLSGQVLAWDQSNTRWSPRYLKMEDVKNDLGTSMFPGTACGVHQALNWNAVTDSFSCQSIGIDASQVTAGVLHSDRLPFGASLWQDGGTGKIYYNSGNLGVGTTNPLTKLVIGGNNSGAAENSTLRFLDTDTTTATNQNLGKIEFYSSDSDATGVKAYIGAFAEDSTPDVYLSFATDTSTGSPMERMKIVSDGRIGMGIDPLISGSDSTLQVAGDISQALESANTSSPWLNLYKGRANGAIVQDGDELGAVYFYGSDGTQPIGGANIRAKVNGAPGTNDMPASLSFATTPDGSSTPITRMTIAASGGVGIADTTPSYTLDVTGDINATGCLRSSAGVASGVCASDERAKDVMGTYDLGLKEILQVRPVRYVYNGNFDIPESIQPEVGVLAQEIEKFAPSLVLSNPDSKEGLKAVNYSEFVWMLINSVKEFYQEHQVQLNEVKKAQNKMQTQIETLNLKQRSELEKQNRKILQQEEQIKNLKIENQEIKAYLCKEHAGLSFCKK